MMLFLTQMSSASDLGDGSVDSDLCSKSSDLILLHTGRICPGKNMGYNNAFVTIAAILATVKIEPALDEHGQQIPVTDELTSETLT